MSAPRLASTGTPTPRALRPVLPSPARLAPRLDMEGAAAPAAGDGPDLGPGAPGSLPEAGAGATAAPAAAAAPEPRKPHGVKRHHHKHNLKHRYELQETLGKGTYGKVKRATERFSGRVVSGENPEGRGLDRAGDRGRAGQGSWARRLSCPGRGFPGPPRQTPRSPPSSPRLRRVSLPKHLLHPVCAYFGGFYPSSKVVFMICKHFATLGPADSPSRARIQTVPWNALLL